MGLDIEFIRRKNRNSVALCRESVEQENPKMKRNDIIDWLRNRLPYAPDHAWRNVMQAAIDALQEQEEQRWIPVTEKMPDNFVSVLGFMTDAGPFPAVRECYSVGDGFFFPALEERHTVSHWKPLPVSLEEG